ncbi:MAG: HEAT repeat domain-containing protein [Candidatus Aminicenantaceae bacterium]
MRFSNFSTLNKLDKGETLIEDPAELQKAKEIIQGLSKTFSLLKVYPPDNPSVKVSIEVFCERITEFLGEYDVLKIGIDEFSFAFRGEPCFMDNQRRKSLPFLFFKDGMREIAFYKGLSREEIQDFLKVVKEASNIPPEDSDIVALLWEKEFPHIQYVSLNEFLDSDIGFGKEELGLEIDKLKLTSDSIKLTQEDLVEIQKIKTEHPASQASLSDIPSIKESDIPEIQSMISASRERSHLKELMVLLFEMLCLEKRDEQFSSVLNVLEKCHYEMVNNKDFSNASILLKRLLDLKVILSAKSDEKAKLIERILIKTKDESSIAKLKDIFCDGKIKDYESFFQYLELLIPETILLIGDIWEKVEEHGLCRRTLSFLEKSGPNQVGTLIKIARAERVSLTKEIISIIGKTGDKKAVPYLLDLARFQDRAISIEIISALKKIDSDTAKKAILKFLFEDDEKVRITAAENLEYFEDKSCLDTIFEIVKKKDFKKKSKLEKEAFLNFLAKSRNDNVHIFFGSLLKKSNILFKKRQNETRLCVVSALESAATPEAVAILKEGTHLRSKSIRQECHIALRKLEKSDALKVKI